MAQWISERLDRLAGRPRDQQARQSAQPAARPPSQPPQEAVASRIFAEEGVRGERAAPAPLISHYEMKQTLGVGAFGKVKLAQHRTTKELFAIKCIQKSRISVARQFERLQRFARMPSAALPCGGARALRLGRARGGRQGNPHPENVAPSERDSAARRHRDGHRHLPGHGARLRGGPPRLYQLQGRHAGGTGARPRGPGARTPPTHRPQPLRWRHLTLVAPPPPPPDRPSR